MAEIYEDPLAEWKEFKAQQEFKIKSHEAYRARQLNMAVANFSRCYVGRQEKVLAYLKKKSGLTELTCLGIYDDTPMVEQFERIFRICPMGIRDDVVWQMDNDGRYYW